MLCEEIKRARIKQNFMSIISGQYSFSFIFKTIIKPFTYRSQNRVHPAQITVLVINLITLHWGQGGESLSIKTEPRTYVCFSTSLLDNDVGDISKYQRCFHYPKGTGRHTEEEWVTEFTDSLRWGPGGES